LNQPRFNIRLRFLAGALLSIALGGCAANEGALKQPFSPGRALPDKQDVDITTVPDAMVKEVTLSVTGNKPYRVFGEDYAPLASSIDYRQQGLASWYGTKFHGRRTASGETFNMYAMSAAHRTLPLPSFVRVTNLDNQRSVIVKVIDRGPFVDPGKRIIDLSYAAAARLEMVDAAPALVRIVAVQVGGGEVPAALVTTVRPTEQIMPGSTPVVPGLENASFLLMGEFTDLPEAEKLLQRLSQIGVSAYIQVAELFSVRSGPYVDADQALKYKLEIDRALDIEARVVFE
jgi:rare lipoprotein A